MKSKMLFATLCMLLLSSCYKKVEKTEVVPQRETVVREAPRSDVVIREEQDPTVRKQTTVTRYE